MLQDWSSSPLALWGAVVWLLGLSCATLFLMVRYARLKEENMQLQQLLREVSTKLDAVATAQQVADLDRKIDEKVDMKLANRGRGSRRSAAVVFEGAASVSGALVGGDVGTISTGASGQAR